jgi:hypothetical protein
MNAWLRSGRQAPLRLKPEEVFLDRPHTYVLDDPAQEEGEEEQDLDGVDDPLADEDVDEEEEGSEEMSL